MTVPTKLGIGALVAAVLVWSAGLVQARRNQIELQRRAELQRLAMAGKPPLAEAQAQLEQLRREHDTLERELAQRLIPVEEGRLAGEIDELLRRGAERNQLRLVSLREGARRRGVSFEVSVEGSHERLVAYLKSIGEARPTLNASNLQLAFSAPNQKGPKQVRATFSVTAPRFFQPDGQ